MTAPTPPAPTPAPAPTPTTPTPLPIIEALASVFEDLQDEYEELELYNLSDEEMEYLPWHKIIDLVRKDSKRVSLSHQMEAIRYAINALSHTKG